MKKLPFPTDEDSNELATAKIYDTCVSAVRDEELRARFEEIRNDIEGAEVLYDSLGNSSDLYQFQPHGSIGNVEDEDLKKLYTGRMVPKKARGRIFYDRIRNAPVNDRCPYCNIGTVWTLDHYLPKGEFPILSVSPQNLVPCCEWCQGRKGEYYPGAKGEQVLHPYFDDFDREIWLCSEVVEDTPVIFRFFADPPNSWTEDDRNRVSKHLEELNLLYLFSANASSRLADIRPRLRKLFAQGGKLKVEEYLSEEIQSREENSINSWENAMYRAAVANEWFCDGGFLNE